MSVLLNLLVVGCLLCFVVCSWVIRVFGLLMFLVVGMRLG